jgi:tetratricopeptide (TPR) repeat protein
MTGRRFAVAEGENLNVDEHWTVAHLLRGRRNLEARRYNDALADFQAATAIPDNLPLGNAGAAGLHNAEAAYLLGAAYEASGDRTKAQESWQRAAAPAKSVGLERQADSYYRGLAMQKLGKPESKAVFEALVKSGEQALAAPLRSSDLSPRACRALAHYLIALGDLGLGDTAGANTELAQAVRTDPSLAQAKVTLASIARH